MQATPTRAKTAVQGRAASAAGTGALSSSFRALNIIALVLVPLPFLVSSAATEPSQRKPNKPPFLPSLPYLDDLRSTSDVTIERVNNVDVVRRARSDRDGGGGGGGGVDDDDDEEEEVAICHLPFLMRFTRGGSTDEGGGNERLLSPDAYNAAAAMLLAAQHLNAADGSVVREVGGLKRGRCNVKFTAELLDTEQSEAVAINHAIRLTDRASASWAGSASAAAAARNGDDGAGGGARRPPPPPCAFIGAGRSAVSIPTSIITGLRGYPQVSPLSTSVELDQTIRYPFFARTIPADDGTAVPVVLYLRDVLEIQHLAVVHVADSYGTSFARRLRLTAAELAPDLQLYIFDMPFASPSDVVRRTALALKKAKNTYFFGILFPGDANNLMREAHDVGIAGTGLHNWFFADAIGAGPVSGSEVGGGGGIMNAFGRNSALGRAYRGAAVLRAIGGMDGGGGSDGQAGAEDGSSDDTAFDRLTRAMRDLDNEADLAYLRSVLPTYGDPDSDEGQGSSVAGADAAASWSTYDSVHSPVVGDGAFLASLGPMTPFLYDATIALGLAACSAAASAGRKGRGRIGTNSNGTTDSTYFDGNAHFNALLNTTFQGASGRLVLDPETGTRDPSSTWFSLVNFVEGDVSAMGNSTITFRAVQTHVFRGGHWVELRPFTFNDGTSNVPKDLPDVTVEPNYLSPALRGIGLTLCLIILILSVGFAAWTHRHKTTRVVRASQPIFLLVICAGTFIMGSSIIPLSMDRGVTDERGCDVACMAFPWLLCFGFCTTFSGLSAKTHRINHILRSPSFRRITVTALDVAKPMFVLLGGNIIVLSLWTALAPLALETVVVTADRFNRPMETYSVCQSEKQAPYVATLAVMNLGALAFALYEAYTAKGISTEFAESWYILKAVACMLLVCFIGIPVLIIATENSSAFFFVFTGIIFVTCCCVQLLIFVPKIRQNKRRERRNNNSMLPNTRTSIRSNISDVTYLCSDTSDRELGCKIVENPYVKELQDEISKLKAVIAARECCDSGTETEALVQIESTGKNDTEDHPLRVSFGKTEVLNGCSDAPVVDHASGASKPRGDGAASSISCTVDLPSLGSQ